MREAPAIRDHRAAARAAARRVGPTIRRRGPARAALRRTASRSARRATTRSRRRRAGDRHGVERVPRARLRARCERLLQVAGRLRRPQHLLARADARARLHVLLHWPLTLARVLVTGGAGYIGSHACKALARPATASSSSTTSSPAIARRCNTASSSKATSPTSTPCAARCGGTACRRVMHFAAFLDVGESVRDPARYYRNNVVGALSVLEAMAAESRAALRVLVDLRHLRRADRDADRRNASAASDQQLRRDEAGGRARAAALRARVRHPLGRAPLFQRRRRRSGRRDRRGSLAGNSPDSARDRGGDRRGPACRCSATTTRRRTARACATTSTSPIWPTRTSRRSKRWSRRADRGAYNLGTGRPHSVREVIDAVERVTGRPVPWTLAPRRPGDPAVLYAAPRQGARRSCAGRRASRTSTRSSAPPGTGTGRASARIRAPARRDGHAARTRCGACSATRGRIAADSRGPSSGCGLRRRHRPGSRSSSSPSSTTCCRTSGASPSIAWAIVAAVSAEGHRLVRLVVPDGRRRPARRDGPAQRAVPPHPRPVGRVLRAGRDRPADVAHQQRRRPGAAGGVGDGSAISRASRWRSSASRRCCSTTTRAWRSSA